MSFEEALIGIKGQQKAYREGWNGKDQSVFLVPAAYTKGNDHKSLYKSHPYLAFQMGDRSIVPWVASQTDLLADDWAFRRITD